MAISKHFISRRNRREPPKIAPARAEIVINVREKYQLRHWSKQFGVTDAELFAAVAQVGPLAVHVRNYFSGLDQPPGQQE
jgi:hypothetical protein